MEVLLEESSYFDVLERRAVLLYGEGRPPALAVSLGEAHRVVTDKGRRPPSQSDQLKEP